MWVWSVLAAVLAHALVPAAEPLAQTRGSAFSAATSDVLVLASARPAEQLTRQRDAPPPPALPEPLWLPTGTAPVVFAAAGPYHAGSPDRPVATQSPRLLGPPSQAPPFT